METESTNWVEVVQLVAFLIFVLAIFGGAISTTTRLVRYLLKSKTPPVILWRDVIARNGLAIPFGAILAVRVLRDSLGWDTEGLATNIWWVLGTSLPAVIGAVVYLYFEIFIIERNGGNGHAEEA